jgi:carboxymethylenebutenolidase
VVPTRDEEGHAMPGEIVDITTQDGIADAYLARPDDDARHPGVLLLMDAFGLRPQIEGMADRIAARGYVVLAPNLFYRAGRAPVLPTEGIADPEQRGPLLERIMPLVHGLTPELLAVDADAYLDALEQAAPGPVAITGYCMGGRVGWQIAAAHPDRVAALGAFHTGGLVTDAEDSPHRSAGELGAELYLGFADNDRSMTAENIATLEHALDDAGVRYRSELYHDAAHGYTMADTPVYDEAAAERHFTELFALLDRSVAGSPAR